VEALAGAALIGHNERELVTMSELDAAKLAASEKEQAVVAAEEALTRAVDAAAKATKWASRCEGCLCLCFEKGLYFVVIKGIKT
jgi:hypothetical protein